jgi:hypothetical protein
MLQKMFDWTYKKIDPKIQRVRGIKVRASVEPLRAESHPSMLHRGVNVSSPQKPEKNTPAIQFRSAQNYDPIVPSWIIFDEMP